MRSSGTGPSDGGTCIPCQGHDRSVSLTWLFFVPWPAGGCPNLRSVLAHAQLSIVSWRATVLVWSLKPIDIECVQQGRHGASH